MAVELTEKQLIAMSKTLKRLPTDERPKTSEELQKFVDESTGVVSKAVDTAIDDSKHLTQRMLEAAGVVIRSPIQEVTTEEMKLRHQGLWHHSEDIEKYEDTKNSYLGSKFIQWMVREKQRYERDQTPDDDAPTRNRIEQYLPPIDVVMKVYLIDAVSVRDNTFMASFTVMLDWEDPSLSISSGEFVPEQHFFPKYSIDNASELDELGDGRRAHPRRDKSTWHVKWTAKYQATLKTPLNPEKYPFDFQELRITIKPNTVDSSKLSFLRESHNFVLSSRLFIEFQHPLRWRRHSGHSLDKNADWLPDFDIVGIYAERTERDYEAYSVIIGIKRDPTNIQCSVAASMLVTSVISSFSFFISEFADALAVVLTALLTAVAFKIIIAEQLPLTPKPSIIEKYITNNLYLFLFQGIGNLFIHLFTANIAEGFLVPEGEEFTCEPEVQYFQVITGRYKANRTGPTSLEQWWCNFASIANLIWFFITIGVISLVYYCFSSASSSKSSRQILAEQTWSCLSDEILESEDPARLDRTKALKRQITSFRKFKSAEIKRDKNKRAGFAPTLRIQGSNSESTVPIIYQSPAMSCIFTVGGFDRNNRYDPACAGTNEKLWCAPESGVDVWHVAQRLSADARALRTHYRNRKFTKLKNVTPQGRCLESFHGRCPLCAPDNGEPPYVRNCTKPRTWTIGQTLFFENPCARNNAVVSTGRPAGESSTPVESREQEETKMSELPRQKHAKVAPASSLKAWSTSSSVE